MVGGLMLMGRLERWGVYRGMGVLLIVHRGWWCEG